MTGIPPESELEDGEGLKDLWKWQWRKEKNIPQDSVCKIHSLDLARSRSSFGHWTQGSVPGGGKGWDSGHVTHRHHDPSVSFGAFEAIQSRATLKPIEHALVNPLPSS